MHKQTMLIEDKTYCLKLTINRIMELTVCLKDNI